MLNALKSKTVWGAIATLVTGATPIVQAVVEQDAGPNPYQLLQLSAIILTTLFTIYGRAVAQGPLIKSE